MNYILRDADDELWARFKERAAKEGHTLRWLVLEMIRRYIQHGLK